VETISTKLKPQDVSNTLWAYATMGTKPGDRIMGLLERRVQTISEEFTSQSVANMMWVFTTMGTKPGERMMGLLDRRVEVISGEIKSQDVANTMWVFVTITKTGDRMLGLLERWAEGISGEFNSQAVVITMWAICFFDVQFDLSLRFCAFLSCISSTIDFDDEKIFRQLHQFFISCDVIGGLHEDLSVSVQTLKEKHGSS
jgi:hypothetical protein